EFRALWARGDSVDPMVADWKATLDALSGRDEIDITRIGWYGLSMGTAYGIPLVAADKRISASVLGMWGVSRPEGSERLMADASKIVSNVMFQQKWDDPLFSREGQFELFDRLGSPDKQ